MMASPRDVLSGLRGLGVQLQNRDGQPLHAEDLEGRFPDGVTATGPPDRDFDLPTMDHVAVQSMQDVCALEAFYLTNQPTALPHPDLALALHQLETDDKWFRQARIKPLDYGHGIFYDQKDLERLRQQGLQTDKRVGRFGAYQALSTSDRQELSDHPIIMSQVGGTPPIPLHTPQHAMAAALYYATGQGQGLLNQTTALALRDRAREGFTFHQTDRPDLDQSPYRTWEDLTQNPSASVVLGVGFHPIVSVSGAALEDATQLPGDVRRLAHLYHRDLQALVESRDMDRWYGTRMVVLAHGNELVPLPLPERWELLQSLRRAEAREHSHNQAVSNVEKDLQFLREHKPADLPLPDACAHLAMLLSAEPRTAALRSFIRMHDPAQENAGGGIERTPNGLRIAGVRVPVQRPSR